MQKNSPNDKHIFSFRKFLLLTLFERSLVVFFVNLEQLFFLLTLLWRLLKKLSYLEWSLILSKSVVRKKRPKQNSTTNVLKLFFKLEKLLP